jgi:dTDP-4-dehydrorhamnose reductase
MKRIALIGATGMLGSMVYGELSKFGYGMTLVVRNKKKLPDLYATYGRFPRTKIVCFDLESVTDSIALSRLVRNIGQVDAVINCAGVIPQHRKATLASTVVLNSMLPHLLSLMYGEKFIHVTTDYVFDGKKGTPYSEKSIPTPNSLYGTTKLLGEPKEKSLVLRMSFIGPELHGGSLSFLGWFLSQRKTIHGYTNYRWNGITTRQCAGIFHMIISKRSTFPKTGLFHVFSTDITKYELLTLLAKKYQKNSTIIPQQTPVIDRRLTTVYDFCSRLHLPSFENMLNEL